MPTQTLQIYGQIGSDLTLRFARILHDFGDGYVEQALVGNSAGDEWITLTFNGLSDRSAQNLTDPEDSVSKTPMEYLLDFVTRRMVDGAAFNVTTTRGATLLVTLADNEVNIRNISKRVGSVSLRCRQVRS